ncbi:hypothetical protein DBB36_20820 [Flavobacterium sp. WLB]|uniref:hypothetical protein n=1 Tax=unclassified Flavobacterium TaxID=196869 RepID=UPI0006ABE02C|nr:MULTISPECIES: hypothetical protein [unclassified Flavobacterium]KOP36319.1 hypothetical protein AKO67_20730 [Flavobacterium sp. VMW]OWU90406.1 hypothetical protein APR43_12685 [Flavobacterium sp. NLM]PUU68062.1 hypothetical protein DBB36_20820 [Flavobacterium sp. WLB]
MNKINLKSTLFFSFVILLLSVNCYAKTDYDESKISGKTNRIVKKIAKVNFLMGSAVGPNGMMPKQFENFLELKKNASINELVTLTNYPNGVVRCYSFWALLDLKNVDLFSIAKNHLSDDTIVYTQFGCLGSDEKVGDFYIRLLTTNYEDEDGNEGKKLLSEKQVKELDSLLIYTENNLDSKYLAIENAEPNEILYPTVRELVIKQHNQNALVALAKYRKESDIELILKNKDENTGNFYTYKAIQNFPDAKFFPFLEKNLDLTLKEGFYQNEWIEFYKAIAAYKNQKALELLSIPFAKAEDQNIKLYHAIYIYDAIWLNKCSLYDALFWKIWQEENHITTDGFMYLVQLDPAKAYELSKRELIPNYQIKNTIAIPNVSQGIFTENLKESILNFILLNDKPLAYNIIIGKIDNADFFDFEIYCKKISELKDDIFIEPLFKRLKNEQSPYVYLRIVETLVSFKNDAINKRILETRKGNIYMTDGWGSDNLDEILKKNNIQ